MKKLGFSSLADSIGASFGWAEMRVKLGLEPLNRKSRGYWQSLDNILKISREFLSINGEDNFSARGLQRLDYHDLASAILRESSWSNIRELLGLKAPQRITKRYLSLMEIKQTLRNLCLEGVAGLAPSQMLILLQQGGFDELPLSQGGDIFKAIASGSLSPQGLIDWSNSEDPFISWITENQAIWV
mgnify:CR=1 FL=1